MAVAAAVADGDDDFAGGYCYYCLDQRGEEEEDNLLWLVVGSFVEDFDDPRATLLDAMPNC